MIFIMSIKNFSKSVRALESLYFIGCNLNFTVRRCCILQFKENTVLFKTAAFISLSLVVRFQWNSLIAHAHFWPVGSSVHKISENILTNLT